MTLDLRGVNTRNKGAELMLRAIIAELGEMYSLAVEPRAASAKERVALGLLLKVGSSRMREARITTVDRMLPGKVHQVLNERYGFVFEDDVTGIIDGSGFSYSDQFDLQKSLYAADKNERAAKAGKPIVLLPQALGPFTSTSHREAFVRIANASSVVYARERASLEYALASGCDTWKIRLAPDFTCLLDAVPFDDDSDFGLLIPSKKIMTETAPAIRDAYIPFLAAGVKAMEARGLTVRAMRHEVNDEDTIAQLQRELGRELPVSRASNALALKGEIGRARMVLGSRFHALVSALCQGVPSIGVGWSHKYEMLFEDYGIRDYVVDPQGGPAAIDALVGEIVDGHDALSASLRQAASREKEKSRSMWDDIKTLLRS